MSPPSRTSCIWLKLMCSYLTPLQVTKLYCRCHLPSCSLAHDPELKGAYLAINQNWLRPNPNWLNSKQMAETRLLEQQNESERRIRQLGLRTQVVSSHLSINHQHHTLGSLDQPRKTASSLTVFIDSISDLVLGPTRLLPNQEPSKKTTNQKKSGYTRNAPKGAIKGVKARGW